MADNWNDEELAGAVVAYRKMQDWESTKTSYSKAAIYRELAAQFDRTAKSFEYRMQNISEVIDYRETDQTEKT